jgi:hypothetical protein
MEVGMMECGWCGSYEHNTSDCNMDWLESLVRGILEAALDKKSTASKVEKELIDKPSKP